jgi:hypothetical protein
MPETIRATVIKVMRDKFAAIAANDQRERFFVSLSLVQTKNLTVGDVIEFEPRAPRHLRHDTGKVGLRAAWNPKVVERNVSPDWERIFSEDAVTRS